MIKNRILVVFLLFIAFNQTDFAQSSSGYSRIGVGDILHSYSSRSLGMGELGVATADGDFINSINPASWYGLSRTRIELSLKYYGTFLSDKNSNNYFGEAEFHGLTFAFPVSSSYGIGIAGGMIPFSNVSYKNEQTVVGNPTTGDYILNYEGSGGITKLFLGSSYKFPFGLSAGASFDYYFGNLNYFSRVSFLNTNNIDTEFAKKVDPSGYGATFGLISPDISSLISSENISNFRIGFSLGYFSELDVDTNLVSTSSLLTDTITFGKAKMTIPIRTVFGLSFVLSKNYNFSLDYMFQQWGHYKFNNATSDQMQDAFMISAGMEYKPARELGATFWEQIIWRCGLSYEKTQYIVNETSINQYSVSGGLSFPMSSANTIDLGLQFSTRGTTESNLIKENLVRFNLGISFGELWFYRPDNK